MICSDDFKEQELLDVHKHDGHEYELEKRKDAVEEAQREENEFKCEYCEYSAHNFNDFGKHMYEKHRTGGLYKIYYCTDRRYRLN